MYCKNCGNQISENDVFCVNCGASVGPPEQPQPTYQPPAQPQPTYQPPAAQAPPYQQQVYEQQPVAVQDRGVYGRFGGLMIYGGLIILLMIIGAVSSGMFLDGRNISNIMLQLLVLMPLAFAVGLTVKAKGVDISLAAMVSLATGIMMSTRSFGAGILIAIIACIIVGAINAVGIHFIKLPGMLVTIVIYIIVGYISSLLMKSGAMRQVRIERAFMYIVPLAAAVVALAAALISSIGKNHRNKFWSTLLVYAASGILAVLYCVAFFARIQAIAYNGGSNILVVILFIALFLGITRFFRSKALGVAFVIIPTLVYVILNNILNILSVSPYIQQAILLILTLIMIFIVLYRGRAHVIGQSLDKQYRAKSWIALIPLFVLLLFGLTLNAILMVSMGRPPLIYFTLAGVMYDVVILVVAVGMSVAYGLMKPKGSTIV